MGIQQARKIVVWNSFELPVLDPANPLPDLEYLKTKQEQYKQVFPSYEMVGWYSIAPLPPNTSACPSLVDLKIHESFLSLNEACIHLQLDSNLTNDLGAVKIYETIKDTRTGQAQLVESRYQIESNEAEGIAVQHVAFSSTDATNTNKLVNHLTVQQNAIEMLKERVYLIYSYMNAVKQGTLEPDASILREISSLCSRLPAQNGLEFEAEFNKDVGDVMLMSYLTLLLKNVELVHALNDKTRAINGKNFGKSRSGTSKDDRIPLIFSDV